ncbi:hypothetical protein CEXT_147341 [Caerostris extrusa]|uniref:Secreted protein n=1 Tax=Caerostris extrusa TaxID=172846 RepID=A0AAV4M6H1_CAEEX|nr:hypothetical protein CEXT_147341 [Caerostris extrusa]
MATSLPLRMWCLLTTVGKQGSRPFIRVAPASRTIYLSLALSFRIAAQPFLSLWEHPGLPVGINHLEATF